MTHHEGSANVKNKGLVVHLVMGVIFILLVSFALWLIWLTYFRVYFDTGFDVGIEKEASQDLLETKAWKQRHFHNVVSLVVNEPETAPLCIKCHKDMPHAESREKRAFLNAHAYFMACEVCHMDYRSGSGMKYRWFNRQTGRLSERRRKQQQYRITPVKIVDGEVEVLETTEEIDTLSEYLKSKSIIDKVRKEALLDRVHTDMMESAVTCKDCHTTEKRPFLPLSELDYSQNRIDELRRMEVTGMVKKYERFYLPNLTRDSGE